MAEQPKPRPEKSSMVEGLKAVGPYLDLGLTFVVAIGGGAWLGYWADQHWGTAPWLLLVGEHVDSLPVWQMNSPSFPAEST